ncbi:MAG: hypothetical protein FJW31_17925 [Acidobacteria bacterium]|nr:hypothetical protein [Acidobacteriota bacterium]
MTSRRAGWRLWHGTPDRARLSGLEQARFGDRLRYEIAEPDADLGAVPVPPLSVQTLVENSVKYAVSPRREGARIVVAVRAVEGGGVAVQVADDGPGFTEAEAGKGHGLDLLRQRVGELGGSLEFERPAEDGMAVRILMA